MLHKPPHRTHHLTQSPSTMSRSEHRSGLLPLNFLRSSHSPRRSAECHYDHEQHAGAEPGVNPRSAQSAVEYSHFKQECLIDIVDYDCDSVKFQRLTNASLISLLKDEEGHGLPPSMVRWINIVGIDWSILSAIALKYNLHSLALEDILHERGHTHSKADYYPSHLFIRILCHSLDQESDTPSLSTPADISSESDTLPQRQAYPDLSYESNARQQDFDIPIGSDDSKLLSETDVESIAALHGKQQNIGPSSVKGKTNAEPQHIPRRHWYTPLTKRLTALSGHHGPAREIRRRQIESLTRGDSVTIKREPLFIFLLRNGTVISIHPTSMTYTSPIMDRLHRPDSILRTSEDASLLVESLVDLVVDRILEVVDEYQVKINMLEHDILLRPAMESVRSLHILSGDLIMHRRTMEPVRTMVYGLRHYDFERSHALANIMAVELESSSDTDATMHDDSSKSDAADELDDDSVRRRRAEEAAQKLRRQRQREKFKAEHFSHDVRFRQEREKQKESHAHHRRSEGRKKPLRHPSQEGGYFSFKAKVYLADVSDHMDFALTSLDMFSAISENLINYAFNIASYDMNTVMNRLTFATIVFLPLTLLTGYYGMNFARFWSVEQHSDVFFWKTAAPVMALLIPLFLFDNIKQGMEFLKRRSLSRRAGCLD
ncbi:hypothetical protein CPC08DRAFT_681803 [Agrocybe pediades]|nr:hypothetical protein CPC08DRAFT_681803 [Agrocybe pediades]